jgi:hypothetical protein
MVIEYLDDEEAAPQETTIEYLEDEPPARLFAAPEVEEAQAAPQEFFSFEDAVSAIGTIPEALAVGVPAAFQKLVTGLEIPEKSEAIESEMAFQERMQREQEDRVASGKATTVGSAIREAVPSLGFSVASMGAAIPAGIGGAIAGGPAAKITGPAAAMAASGTVAYRMAGSDLMYRAYKQLEEKKGSPLTDEEKAEYYKTILPIAQNSALWEAGPEAISNAVTVGVGKFVFGFGKGAAKEVVDKSIEAANKTLTRKIAEKGAAVAGGVATELGTETVTAVGQFPQEAKVRQFVETGSTEGAPTEYPGGAIQAAKDVAPATLALSGILLGAGGGVKLATLPFQRQKSPEQIAEDNINLEADRVSRELSIGDTDEETKGIAAALTTARDNLTAKKEVYTALEPTDPAAESLGLEIRQMERDVAMLDTELRKRTGEPLAQAEARQAELATAIAEEPLSATITGPAVVSEEGALVSEITPAAPELIQDGVIRTPLKGVTGSQQELSDKALFKNQILSLPDGTIIVTDPDVTGEAQQVRVSKVGDEIWLEDIKGERTIWRPGQNEGAILDLKGGIIKQPAAPTIGEKPPTSPMIGAEPTQPAPAEGVRKMAVTVRDLWEAPQQQITSAATSINQRLMPSTFKRVEWTSGTVNADIGGGRFDNATDFLSEKGVENVIYDPFNRSEEWNKASVEKIADGKADTATINNVLNVIKEEPARDRVVRQAANALKPGGTAYFLIYEGIDGKAPGETKAGWQENRKAETYIPEIQAHFNNVQRKGNMIIASSPKTESGRRMMTEKVAPVPVEERVGQVEIDNIGTKLFGGKRPANFFVVDDDTDPEYEYKAAYYPEKGYIIVNNAFIRKGENVQDIINHELGHYIFSDTKVKKAFDNFYNALSPEEQAQVDNILETAYNQETAESRIEEQQVISFSTLARTPDTRNLFQKLVDAIKAFWNRVTGAQVEFATPERTALAMLSTARRRFKKGERIEREGEQAPRRMAAEPRRTQIAGMQVGQVITTPEGINRKTEDIIKSDVFDSTTVSPENTAKAYDLIDRLRGPDRKSANDYAEEINDLTRNKIFENLTAEEKSKLEGKFDRSLGAVKLGNELLKYAVNLAGKGDLRMMQLLIDNVNDLATGFGTVSTGGAVLQARQNLAEWVRRTPEAIKTGIVNAVAIQIYGPSATQEQIDLIRDAVNAVNKTRVEDADAIYTDLEETGSRTGVEIRKAVERAMDKADASSKDPWVMALEIVKAIEGFQKFTYEGLTISVPQNIKNLVSKNLANYRKKMKTKGADGLEKTFWKTMSDQENKMGPLGEVDAAVGRNLAAIVKDTLIKLGLKGEPPDTKMTLIEQVANILSNNELSTDRMVEADKRISEEIAARRGQEISDAEDANAGPETIDAIEAKWEGIQQAWDESMSRQMDIPVSDATLRRLISNELKEDKTSISQFVKEVGDDLAISNARKGAIINKIISKLNGLNEDGSIKRDYTKLEEFLSSQFDQMVANQKLKNRMRSAVKKVAKEADPNKQADRQIERLAELQSDVQRWSQKREDKVRDIVAEDLRQRLDLGLKVADKIRRNWKPVLVQRLVDAGVSQDTAGILADIVWRQHEINYLNRKMAQVERAVTKGSLAPIIDAIKNTPLAQQQDPAWKRKVAYDYLINAGLDAQTAGRLADLMDATLQKVLAAAQAKAFEDTLKGKLGDQRSRRGMEKFLRAIRTGAIDPTKNLTSEIAAANGWTGFTSEQYARLSELDSIVNDKTKGELELAAAFKEIQDILAEAKLQPKVREALAAYYTANALSGIPTATVNIFSPIGFALRNLMTDTMKNLATNPAALPATFDTFVSSWKTYFSEVAFSFKNNVQRRGVVEYLSNDDVLLRLYNKGKKQWQQGNRREGIKNMVVGMMEYVGRLLKALDEGAVSVLEQQGLTRYAMDAMKQAGISSKDARAAANAVLSKKQAFIEEMVAKGMNKTQAKAMSDDVFRSAWVEALTNFKLPSQDILNASLNDALASVGRINNTMDGLKQEERNIRDLGFASAPPIGLLERLGESLNSDQATETQRVFYRMVYGFAIVPARVFREAAWFSPYGFVRFAVNHYSKKGGGAGRYAQSLGTDAQFRQRLTETIAGTVVLGSLLALSKGSDEDPFDELPFKIVVTGNGPERRLDPQYHSEWNGKYKRNAIHFFFGKTVVPINIERGFEAFAIPFMLAGAYDDMKIRKRFEASKATPTDLTDASILAGAAFTAFNRRGPYSAFMDGLIRTQSADDTIPQLAKQAMFLGKTFIPGVGTSLARNLSDFISDPVDTKSMEGALWSNVPVIGPMIGTKSMNAFGETTGPRDLSARMYRGGLPIVFDLPNNSQTEKLRDLVISKGQGPDIPTRYDVRRRLGYEPTNDQFEAYVKEYGRHMADTMTRNYNSLRGLNAKSYVKRIQSFQQRAGQLGESAAKKVGNPDQP